jgi:hypothetical protein
MAGCSASSGSVGDVRWATSTEGSEPKRKEEGRGEEEK